MYKILNDDNLPSLGNSSVKRNADQTDYHLRNSATDLTLPKPKREFQKKLETVGNSRKYKHLYDLTYFATL